MRRIPPPNNGLPPILRSATVLVVTAHPDDESYAAAGTIRTIVALGGQAHLVCATHGERGTSHLKSPMSAQRLGRLRAKELRAAGKVLSLSSIRIFHFPDGKVSQYTSSFFRKLSDRCSQIHVDAILSFGADGISGHVDHISVGNAARKVAQKNHIPFIQFSLPPTIQHQAQQFLRSRRKSTHYANAIKYQQPNWRIVVNQRIKKQALRSHVSQLDGSDAFTGFPPFAVRELLKYEYLLKPRK